MNLDLKDFQAVIFDMDGTMVNNMVYHRQAWQVFTQRHHLKITPKQFQSKYSGKKNNFILPDLFKKKLTPSQIATYAREKEKIYRQLYQPHLQAIPGLLTTLKKIYHQQLPLAIATTAPKLNREQVLKKLKIKKYFQTILGDEDVKKGKPHPEIYLKTAQKLEVKPKKCLVFEDSPSGVAAAKTAGMTVIGLMTSHKKLSADYTIKNYRSLKFI